jgi:hypothetical protein
MSWRQIALYESKLSCDVIFHTYSAFWTTSAFGIFPLLNVSRCTLVFILVLGALHLVMTVFHMFVY